MLLTICISNVGDAFQTDLEVDFSRDIRPILSDTCFKCHGPDEHERKSGLRLDTQEAVFDEFEVVVPGDLDASELYQRIVSDDQAAVMPPLDSGRKLTDSQKRLVKQWIEQGAQWEQHWAFVPPVKAELPKVKQTSWTRNAIDHFVLSRLEREQLTPNSQAERSTLIRRVCFDLTGLPPVPELATRYRQMESADWYEQLVDELLQTEQYGEHMARYWLDAARYGDTHGLHLDNYREMWPYRDWVIQAFNRNLSFKDFTIEQLAGDMLENASQAQQIASGFNRAHVTTNEGGSITEEVYVRNVVDRVSTTGTVFLGLTVGCAQCHDHKFDPISQTEFYQLFAYFNNMTDPAMDKNIKDPPPVLRVASEEQKQELANLEQEFAAADEALKKLVAEYVYVEPELENFPETENPNEAEVDTPPLKRTVWIDDVLPVGAKPEQNWNYVNADKGPVHSGQTSRLQSGNGMIQHFFTGATAQLRVHAGDQFFAYVYLDPENPPEQIMLQFNDGNWEHRAFWGGNKIDWGQTGKPSRFHMGDLPETGKWIELQVPVEQVGFQSVSMVNGIAFTQFGGKAYWDAAGVDSTLDQTTEFRSLAQWLELVRSTKGAGLPGEITKLVQQKPEDLNPKQSRQIEQYFVQNVHPDAKLIFAEPKQLRDALQQKIENYKNQLPTTLVSQENETIKPAYLLKRGEYDQQGEPVQRATPAALHPFPADAPNNRLGFARWIVAPENPLTARVAVNRFWQQLFGTGIVKTSEDFGAQGDVPSHPQLLDWLAVDFVEHDWDVKRLMKLLVMSATYRQSSQVTPELFAKDPDNRLLARGPRFRLDAEMLRDQALAVSGLLVEEIGGPSVKPPQPDGLWFVVGYSGSNTVRFKQDVGHAKVHRRSLYTFWKRTAPPPQMNTFDAPSRESCIVRRERTNTPLQALLLMNDPQYVEAARYLAQRTLDATANDHARAQFMFETAIGRTPSSTELDVLLNGLKSDRDEFEQHTDSAEALVAIGEQPAGEQYDAVELAAWTMAANLIMNMDEFVTKN